MTPEAERSLEHLARIPRGNTTVTLADLKVIMLETYGRMMAYGSLYEIVSNRLAPGVYRLTLRRWKP